MAVKNIRVIYFRPSDETFTSLMLERIQNLENFLSSGGKSIYLPGRYTEAGMGRWAAKKGAFTLAKRFQAPIQVLMIKNTNKIICAGKIGY